MKVWPGDDGTVDSDRPYDVVMRSTGANEATPAHGAAPVARCPRCHYDVSAHLTTWREQCPMAGVCSECGLAFSWADLLCPERQNLPWLYEHVDRWWNLRAAWSTAFRALIPWRFWKRVQVHHRVAPRRLAVWAPLLWLTFYGCLALFILLSGVIAMTASPTPAPNALFPITRHMSSATAKQAVLSPDHLNVIITETLSDAQVTLPVPETAALHDTSVGPILLYRRGSFEGWSYDILHPQSDDPTGVGEASTGTQLVLIAPDGTVYHDATVIAFLPAVIGIPLTVSELIWNPLRDVLSWLNAIEILLVTIGFTTTAAVIVFVCPSQWRRRNVRSVHLLRIAALSLALSVAIMTLSAPFFIWIHGSQTVWLLRTGGVMGIGGGNIPFIPGSMPSWLVFFLSDHYLPFAFVGVAGWMSMYWWFALHRGMQLRWPVTIWLFLTIGGVLGMLVAYVLPGYGRILFY